MKKNKNLKKLFLNKNTVSHLNEENLLSAKGGAGTIMCATQLTPQGGSVCIACYTDPNESRNVACFLSVAYGNC